jgi:RNA polymerase sigma-70 factor, ECF subfamily
VDRGAAESVTDEQLVARIGGGDQAAVAVLHERFAARVYFIALREMRSPADAEDVRNETLTRVLDAIRNRRLTTPAALPGFVVSTARNVMREFSRQVRRAEPILDRDFVSNSTPFPLEHEARQAVEMVIRRLKPRERTFLRLFYYDELPKEEISRQLGVPEERLRLIKSRALKSFRAMYGRLVK